MPKATVDDLDAEIRDLLDRLQDEPTNFREAFHKGLADYHAERGNEVITSNEEAAEEGRALARHVKKYLKHGRAN